MLKNEANFLGLEELERNLFEELRKGHFLFAGQILTIENRPPGAGILDILKSEEMLTPATLRTVLGFILAITVVDLTQFRIQSEALALVPKDVAQELGVLPLSVEGDVLCIAIGHPENIKKLVKSLGDLTRKRIKPVLSLHGDLEEAIKAAYEFGPQRPIQ